MAQGRLEVTGTIDLNQFWPKGSSDADTTKIVVATEPGAFRFLPNPIGNWQSTDAFQGAKVKGQHGTKDAIDKSGRITVRLQGIDAPELHYEPSAALPKKQRSKKQDETFLKLNKDYRQHVAETATVKLSEFLHRAGSTPLPCTVVTAVDEPGEIFDVYGRFVGDIVIRVNGEELNVNTWLVHEGWAFPAFYNTMSDHEIKTLTDAANEAWGNDRGVWPHQCDEVGALDWNLIYRRPSSHPVPDSAADQGPVILPKLFRRLSTWAVNKKAGMVKGSFKSYLKSKADACHLTSDYIEQGASAAVIRYLEEFLDGDGFFSEWPEDLVFREQASTVVGPDGKPVHW